MKVWFGREGDGGATLFWRDGAWVDANLDNSRMEGEFVRSCKGLSCSWRRCTVVVFIQPCI